MLSVGNGPEELQYLSIIINKLMEIRQLFAGVHSDKFISKKLKNKYRIFPFKGSITKYNQKKNLLMG